MLPCIYQACKRFRPNAPVACYMCIHAGLQCLLRRVIVPLQLLQLGQAPEGTAWDSSVQNQGLEQAHMMQVLNSWQPYERI